MEIKHIVKGFGLLSILTLSSFTLVSCDSNSSTDPNEGEVIAESSFKLLFDNVALGHSIEAGDSVSANGVTFTFTEVNTANGSKEGAVDDFGIIFSNQTFPAHDFEGNDVNSFSFKIDRDIRILTYTLGFCEDVDGGRSFIISSASNSSGENLIPEASGFVTKEAELVFQAGDVSYLMAGEIYTFTNNLTNVTDSLASLIALEVIFVDVE